MPETTAHFREAGAGAPVLCLHSSASHSGQWRALKESLSDRFRVIAADLYCYGKSPAWPAERPMYLDDQIALIEPLIRAGEPVHLVGHSLGGAIALKAALTHPESVRSLAVFEPVLFNVLAANGPDGAAAREISAVRDDTIRLADEGDLDGAARRFVDYWVGDGAWAATPEEHRPHLAAGMLALRWEWHAGFCEPTPLAAFAEIGIPTLYLTGSESKLSTRTIAALLTGVLPNVRAEEVEGVGHMAPVTHPHRVNPSIERFLMEHRPATKARPTPADTASDSLPVG
jgi:pimeloyl-ACP methyl ester carboxylesterase